MKEMVLETKKNYQYKKLMEKKSLDLSNINLT